MLSFKNFQKLYDGNYDWIIDQFIISDNINEANIEKGTFAQRDRGVIHKNIDLAKGVTDSNTWKIDNVEIELTDESKKKLLNILNTMSKLSSEEIEKKWRTEWFPLKDHHLETTNGKKIRIDDLDKTNSFNKEKKMSSAEKTARQESLAAVGIMMVDQLSSNGADKFPDFPKVLENIGEYGDLDDKKQEFVVNDKKEKKFAEYFLQGRSQSETESLIGRTFSQLMEFLYIDSTWLDVTIKTAKSAFIGSAFGKSVKDKNKKYEVHRGSEFMNLIYRTYQNVAINSGIDKQVKKDDKWNPGDVWMVEKSRLENLTEILNILAKSKTLDNALSNINDPDFRELKGIDKDIPITRKDKFTNLLHYYNWLIREWYDKDFLKGISLKKFDDDVAPLSVYNDNPANEIENIEVDDVSFRLGKVFDPLKTKDVYVEFDVVDNNVDPPKTDEIRIQFRNFSQSIQSMQGEIIGKDAKHGKVGLGVIRYMMDIEKTDPDFMKWRKQLSTVYLSTRKQRRNKVVKSKHVVGIDDGMKELKKNQLVNMSEESFKRMLVFRIFKLMPTIFPQVKNRKFVNIPKEKKDFDKLKLDVLVSKLQVLEVCFWMSYLIKKNIQGKMKIGKKTINDTEINLLMKRLYLYATSRGNIETGAFSSKFMKIG